MDKNTKSFIYYMLHAIFVFFAVAASAASISRLRVVSERPSSRPRSIEPPSK